MTGRKFKRSTIAMVLGTLILAPASNFTQSFASQAPSQAPSPTSAAPTTSSATPSSSVGSGFSPNATSSQAPTVSPSSAAANPSFGASSSPSSGQSPTPVYSPTPGAPTRPILTGWIPYYAVYSSKNKSNGGLDSAIRNHDLIREVMPFWYTLTGPGKIVDLYTPANPNFAMSLTLTSLRQAGFAILPTITDGTSTRDPKTGASAQMVLSNLISTDAGRAQLVATISNLVQANNFDGIDLDFEDFAFIDGNSSWPTTQPRWVAFISSLAAALHQNGKLLSVTTPVLFDPSTGKKGYYVYAWSQISSYIDRLRIMAYDYSTSTAGPIGPINWAEAAVKYAVSVVPASKVYLGIPGYGRDWVTGVVGTCPSAPINYTQSVKVGAPAATFIVQDAANLAASYGATPTYLPQFGESTFTYSKTYSGTTASGALTNCTATRTVWYEDPQAFYAKAGLVATYHLGGLAEWTLGMESPAATDAIRVVAQNIAPDQVQLVWSNSQNQITYGELAGGLIKARKKDGSPIANLPISITDQISGQLVASVVTDQSGQTGISFVSGKNLSLQASSAATWQLAGANSAIWQVQIIPKLSLNPIYSVKAGTSFHISGHIWPPGDGSSAAQFQLNISSSLNLVNQKATVAADGNFDFLASAPIKGFYTFHLSSPATSTMAAVAYDGNVLAR